MGCKVEDWQDRPSSLFYWSAGVLLLGVVLFGWLLVQVLSSWWIRLR